MDFFLFFTTDAPHSDTTAACTTSIPNLIAASPPPDAPALKDEEEKRIEENPKNINPTLPTRSTTYEPPFTLWWTLARLRDDPDRAVGILKNWSHNKRHREVNEQTVLEINRLEETTAVKALQELKEPYVFVRGTRGSKLAVSATVVTLDTRAECQAHALIDSGCEGSCIDHKYVRDHNINTQKLARPIPVINADGQPNSEGPITETVTLELRIGDHWERKVFGVTNLGKGQIFLGHDWLKNHNPSVDWNTGLIEFNRCPFHCFPQTNNRGLDLDFEDDHLPEEPLTTFLEDGDRLLICDPTPALNIRAMGTKSTELAMKKHDAEPKKTTEELVPEYLHDFRDVFEKKDFEELPPSRPWDHAIELLPGSEERLSCKNYSLSPTEQVELDKFLEEHLKSGRIRPSNSPMASPFFFVKKKDGALRPVQDYRKLNDMTIKNRYPLPLISELVDALQNAKYFTKLDVRWGYNNVRIKEGDEYKAAFKCNRGLYEPLVMFFGLTNSPSTFQQMMNDIFHVEVAKGQVLIYLDDILIFHNDLETHHRVVREVLNKLRENKLYLKPEKCEFDALEVEYLGMIISQGSVRMDPVKVDGITSWPIPQDKRDVQSFLGFCNFYRRFIRDFAKIAHPLHQLTGNTPFEWTKECLEAFDQLKSHITTAPILSIPNDHDTFRLECDASAYAVGAVLSQHQENQWRPIAFLSKSLTETQRNYEVYDRELLAIMAALQEFRKYLMGAHTFEIYTDHANLQYFKQPQKLNRRQARWFTELQEYHFTLHHIPGKSNSKADILSRRPGFEKGVDDNDNVTLLPKNLFSPIESSINTLLLRSISSHELTPITFLPQILRANKNLDERVAKALKTEEEGWKTLEDGTITYQDRVYIPIDKKLRGDIIRAHHDTPLSGHYGRFKTAECILRDYWWPTLQRDVKSYVDGCETCQRIKPHRVARKTPLHPFDPPARPWDTISIDLIGPLPESQGYNAILTIVDCSTKAVKFEPTHMELTSEGVARILRDRVVRDHGVPRRIISDRDTRFVSKYLRDLCTILGISQNPSTAYHPQTDGQTERMNQTVEQYLRAFINHRQDDWKEWLSTGEFSYNNSVHAATQQTPFFLNSGQHPWKGDDTRQEIRTEAAVDFAKRLKSAREDAQAAMRYANEQTKASHDQHARPAVEYQPGDQVYLEATNLKTNRPSKKLDDKRFGPFKVEHKVGASAYKLVLPDNWPAIHPVFNESYLSPYRNPRFPNQRKPPPPLPIEVEGEREYEVEEIRDSRKHRGRLQYLVHWKGYPREEDSWEPAKNVQHATQVVADFHRQNPSRPKATNAIHWSPKPSLPPLPTINARCSNIRAVRFEVENDETRGDSEREEDIAHPRLYNHETNVHGEEFKRITSSSHTDVILPLSPEQVDDFLEHFEWLNLAPWPNNVRRVWIYEMSPLAAITTVVSLGDRHRNESVHLLPDPLDAKKLRGKYGVPLPRTTCYAPEWLFRDYGGILRLLSNEREKTSSLTEDIVRTRFLKRG